MERVCPVPVQNFTCARGRYFVQRGARIGAPCLRRDVVHGWGSDPGTARGTRHEDARERASARNQGWCAILLPRQPSRSSRATRAYRLISVVVERPAGSSASYRPAEGISGPPICPSCRPPVFEFPCCCASGPWTWSFSVVVRPWRGLFVFLQNAGNRSRGLGAQRLQWRLLSYCAPVKCEFHARSCVVINRDDHPLRLPARGVFVGKFWQLYT